MNDHKIALAPTLSFAWKNFVEHWNTWVVVTLFLALDIALKIFALVIVVGASIIRDFIKPINSVLPLGKLFHFDQFSGKMLIFAIIFYLIFDFIGGIFRMGAARIALDLYDTGSSSSSRLLSCTHLIFKQFIANLLYLVMVISGLAFLIIPGIFLALRFFFFQQIIIDTGCGPLEALYKSAQITKGAIKKLFLIALFFIIITSPFSHGSAAILTLFFIPITYLAAAYLYRSLQLKNA